MPNGDKDQNLSTSVIAPIRGSVDGMSTPLKPSPTIADLAQNLGNVIAPVSAAPIISAQETYLDTSSLEVPQHPEGIQSGSLVSGNSYFNPSKLRVISKVPFVITAMTIVVALVIAGLGTYIGKKASKSASVAST